MPDRYALRDQDPLIDGEGLTWWLYLDARSATPHIGPFPLEPATMRGWWRVPTWAEFDPATSLVELVKPGSSVITGYRLTISTPDYSDNLGIDDYRDRVDPDDDEYDPKVAALYEPERQDVGPVREPVEGPWLILDGAPPPDDGMGDWIGELPYELRHRPEYLHLFPGHFSGFRDAMKRALEDIAGVSVYGASSATSLSVSVRLTVPKLEPPDRWDARPNLKGRTARDRKKILEQHNSGLQQVTRQLEIPCADHVRGGTRAEAKRAWDETIAEVVEYVRDIVAQKCPACGGRGFIEPNQED